MFHQDLLGRMFHKNLARSEDNVVSTKKCFENCTKSTRNTFARLLMCVKGVFITLSNNYDEAFLNHRLKTSSQKFIKVLNMPMLSLSSILDLKNSLLHKTTLIYDGTEMHLGPCQTSMIEFFSKNVNKISIMFDRILNTLLQRFQIT